MISTSKGVLEGFDRDPESRILLCLPFPLRQYSMSSNLIITPAQGQVLDRGLEYDLIGSMYL